MQSKENIKLCIVADHVRGGSPHPEVIAEDEAFTEKLGEKLASVLRLRRDPEHRDRWQTSFGSKTNQGLASTVIQLLEDSVEQ
jgi:hypothetical protein